MVRGLVEEEFVNICCIGWVIGQTALDTAQYFYGLTVLCYKLFSTQCLFGINISFVTTPCVVGMQ